MWCKHFLTKSLFSFSFQRCSLVRKIVSNDEVPDCMHKCTVAVQLADSRHIDRLEPRHKTNSSAFARFVKRLRKEEVVAIVGKDKHDRFGILVPMGDGKGADSPDISADDCAAFMYTGDVREVMEFLASRVTTSAVDSAALNNGASGGLWQPPGGDSEGNTWEPPGAGDDANGGFSAPWDTNHADSATAWEENGGDESNSAWAVGGNKSDRKRSFDEMHSQDNEANAGGGNTFHADSGAVSFVQYTILQSLDNEVHISDGFLGFIGGCRCILFGFDKVTNHTS